jgi:putative ABC transport system permease protein
VSAIAALAVSALAGPAVPAFAAAARPAALGAAAPIAQVLRTGTLDLGWLELALAAVLVLATAVASLAFRLGMARGLLLAALRAAAQLAALGLVLRWVFTRDHPLVVLLLMLAMATLAGHEAVRRTRHRVRGGRGMAMLVVVATSMAVTAYATQVVLRVEPWHEPRYLIPILGMILGNTLNGISLGLDAVLAGLRRERVRVEGLLAHGATRALAARDVVRDAVRTGLVPVVNMMIAAGAISIPGMMTGQILAGEEPFSAARYQMFILFAIAGGTALGTVGVVLLAARLAFDERDRLRLDRIQRVE